MTTANLDMGREALVSLAAKFTMSLFGFVGVVVFANVLGPSGVGEYYFAYAVALLLVRTSAGLGQAIKKRVSEVETNPGPYLGLGLAAHALYLGAVGVVLVALTAVVSVKILTPLELLGVVLVFGTVGLFQILNRFYQGIGYPGRSFWYDTVRSVFTLAFQLALLWAGMEAFGILLGIAIASVLTSVMVFVAAGVRPELPSRETVTNTKSFARWSIPTSLVNDAYKRADPILIGVLVGPSAVGFYESALRLVLPASQLTSSISNPLNVKTSGRSSLGEDVREDVANAMTYAGLLGIPIFFGALAMPDLLMGTFFGADFDNAGSVLVGISLFYLFYIYQLPLESAINGTDRPRLVFRVNLFGLLIHLPLAAVLALEFGVLGVVAATLVAELVMFTAFQYLCTDVFGGPIFPRPIAAQVASGAVMYAVVTQLRPVLSPNYWLPVVVLVGVGALVYFLALVALSSHFRLTVRNVFEPVYDQLSENVTG